MLKKVLKAWCGCAWCAGGVAVLEPEPGVVEELAPLVRAVKSKPALL